MTSRFFLIVGFVSILVSGCSRDFGPPKNQSGSSPGGRYEISVDDPADRRTMDEIRDAELNEKTEKQIAFLKSKGHDIQWFDSKVPVKIARHQTVQIVYFDYDNHMISWCSGAFVSNRNISTAGHCNHGILTTRQFSTGNTHVECRGRVLFAYKPTEKSEIQYFPCDQLQVQIYQDQEYIREGNDGDQRIRNRHWDLKDYALFSIPFVNGSTVTRPEFQSIRSAYALYDWNTLAIAVDPPKDGSRYAFKMDVILGRTIETTEVFGMISSYSIFVKGIFNVSENGNSGSPLYVRSLQSETFRSAVNIDDSDWIYVGPLFGRRWNSRLYTMVYTNPLYFADDYKKFF